MNDRAVNQKRVSSLSTPSTFKQTGIILSSNHHL
jgi:hypothetical protein